MQPDHRKSERSQGRFCWLVGPYHTQSGRDGFQRQIIHQGWYYLSFADWWSNYIEDAHGGQN